MCRSILPGGAQLHFETRAPGPPAELILAAGQRDAALARAPGFSPLVLSVAMVHVRWGWF